MGGNVFGNTQPIKKEYIQPTLQEFVQELNSIFPKARRHTRHLQLLGSAGKKEMSGDIDLALDSTCFGRIQDWDLSRVELEELFQKLKERARTSTDDFLRLKAAVELVAKKIENSDTDIYAKAEGHSLFLQFPQYDENHNKLEDVSVQIDLNFGNVDWLRFAYYSEIYSGSIKGLHRTQLLVALFSYKGYTFSHAYGIKGKKTQEIVSTTPSQAVELLNSLYGTEFTVEDLANYFTIVDWIQTLPKKEFSKIVDTYLQILDKTRTDIPEDLQAYWIENQKRLSLTGKFLPETSNLYKHKAE